MANDEELSDALVRDYFIKKGGKVKRDELFDHFRSQLGKFDDQGTSKNRFGDIVNSLASLQNIEGEKYFVLKKTRNGTTPVLLRRTARQVNQRKDKGVSLPASMKNFRFSTAEDALGNVADNKLRPNAVARARAGFKSESSSNDVGMRRNNSDTSITENGQANDSGLDTAVSESTGDSRQSSLSRNSEYDRLSQNSGDTGIFNEDDHYEHDVPSHVLTPSEKSWMMSAMVGNKSDIICQLEVDPNIVLFKDFIMTALHWASKQGNEDIVRLLVDGGADVNIKSGFTPLHLATMHDKVNIINLLIDEYHANVHIRDHSGKEPKDVVKKNIPENIKQKLTDPKAAMVLEELAKKFPASLSTDSTSGLSKYMETKDSPKLKPKLKGGASFRFLQKKPKKLRRSDRPVIEHWDSSRQERLQSTLESNEKELYKMQRSNSGSLFPVSFYSGKRVSQSGPVQQQPDTVDGAGELRPSLEDVERNQTSLSRSYPENEFRNLARISESDPQESSGDHRSPSGSISTSSAGITVQSDENVLGSKVNYSTSGVDSVFEGDSRQRRAYSENNLKQYESSQDEVVPQLTIDDLRTTGERPPSVFAEDTRNLEKTTKATNEDLLTLKLDSSSEMKSVNFNRLPGDDLAPILTLPDKTSGVSSQEVGEMSIVNGNVSDFGEAGKAMTEAEEKKARSEFVSNKELKPYLSYKDEPFTTLSSPSEHEPRETKPKSTREKQIQGKQQKKEQEPQIQEPQPVYHNDKIIPIFNNNYKQVSEILTSEKQNNIEETPAEPLSPVRPPRKKDKRRKQSVERDQHEQNIFDFESGNASRLISSDPKSKQSFDGTSSSYMTDKNELNTTADKYTEVSAPPESMEASKDMNYRAGYKDNEMYLERNNYLVEADNKDKQLNTNHQRRKYKDAVMAQRDLSEELSRGYSNPEHTRRESYGLAGRRTESDESMFKQYSKESTRRKSDGFYKVARERSSHEEFLKPNPEYTRPKSDGFKDQRRSEGFPRQKEVSLDHPRRRTIHNPPPRTNQSDSRHFLPDVLLDTSRRRASSGYTKEARGDPTPMRTSQDDLGNQRAPPPYRPRPSLVNDTPPHYGYSENEQGNRRLPSRPNYTPPPPPPNWKSQEINDYTSEYSLTNPDSRQVHPPPKGDHLYTGPSSVRPSELSYHSSEDLSNNSRSVSRPSYPPPTVSPTAPPRKHRGSVPRSSDNFDYPPPEVSPTAPPRKHRGSVHRASEDLPRTNGQTSRPKYPPPSVPSNVPPSLSSNVPPSLSSNVPPPLSSNVTSPSSKSQGVEEYSRGREVSLDHPRQRSWKYDPGDNTIISPNTYYPSEYRNFEAESSVYNQSERKDFYPSDSSYRQSPAESSFQYSTESSRRYPSEYSHHFEPTAARDLLPGNGNPSLRRRSAVDTTTRDQSPPDEVVLARSITSEHERYPEYPGGFRNDVRQTAEYIPTQTWPENSEAGYGFDRRNGAVSRPEDTQYENEFDAVLVPKYDGYISRPEQNLAMEIEPEFIVARQMTSHEGVSEARPVMRGSREEMDTLPGGEMKSKWVSTSSDGSNEGSEKRNKYRMTSMI